MLLKRVLAVLPGHTSSTHRCFRYEVPILKRMHRRRLQGDQRLAVQRLNPETEGSLATGEIGTLEQEFKRTRKRWGRDKKSGEHYFDMVYQDIQDFAEEFEATVKRDAIDIGEGVDMTITKEQKEYYDIEEIDGVGHSTAKLLVDVGLDTVEKIGNAELEELEAIDGIGPSTAVSIREDARDRAGITSIELE